MIRSRRNGWRKLTISLLLMCAMLVGCFGNCMTAHAEGEKYYKTMKGQYQQTTAREMLKLINEFRTGSNAWAWEEDNTTKTYYNNLGELQYDYELEKVAMLRAMEIAVSFSHTRPNGTRCFTAYSEYGYVCGWKGENIAARYPTYQSVFEGWKEEDDPYEGQGHRRNMLSDNFKSIGIGHVVYGGWHYWVQEFSDKVVGATETPANDSDTTVKVEVPESLADKVEALTGTVTITGTLESRQTLTATVTGSNNTGTLSYQWMRGEEEIEGATKADYLLNAKDVGKIISCVVTSDTQTGSITGKTSKEIAKMPFPYEAPGATTPVSARGAKDGKITNVFLSMEYATKSDFSDAKNCMSTTVSGLGAGVYYVRYFGGDDVEPGIAVALTIQNPPGSQDVGDVNDDDKVNRADRIYLARYLAEWFGYGLTDDLAADVNKDKEVNRADRIYLARCLAKWEGYELK